MDVGVLLLLTLFISGMVFIVQRSEPKRRLLVTVIMLIPAELIRRYVYYRNTHTEAWIALVVGLVLNFLFWVLIGRYNPMHTSDEIKVIEMDD